MPFGFNAKSYIRRWITHSYLSVENGAIARGHLVQHEVIYAELHTFWNIKVTNCGFTGRYVLELFLSSDFLECQWLSQNLQHIFIPGYHTLMPLLYAPCHLIHLRVRPSGCKAFCVWDAQECDKWRYLLPWEWVLAGSSGNIYFWTVWTEANSPWFLSKVS